MLKWWYLSKIALISGQTYSEKVLVFTYFHQYSHSVHRYCYRTIFKRNYVWKTIVTSCVGLFTSRNYDPSVYLSSPRLLLVVILGFDEIWRPHSKNKLVPHDVSLEILMETLFVTLKYRYVGTKTNGSPFSFVLTTFISFISHILPCHVSD